MYNLVRVGVCVLPDAWRSQFWADRGQIWHGGQTVHWLRNMRVVITYFET